MYILIMSGAYTRRGQALLASLERIQDSLQMVTEDSYRDIARQVSVVKQSLDSIRRDFNREVKQLAKNHKNQNIVGRFGGVKKVKVFEMDSEIAKLGKSKTETFEHVLQEYKRLAPQFE